jgi:putative peptidoglycan lipid II flippase
MLKSVGLLMGATLLGRVFTLVREMLVANYFGATAQTDAYNVALTITTALLTVTVAPIAGVLVPVYVERLNRDQAAARELLNSLISLYFLLLSTCLLLAYLLAPALVSVYGAGFAPETADLAARLTRILALFMVTDGFFGYFQMILTARKDFVVISLAPLITSLVGMGVLWGLAAAGVGVDAMAWGLVAGNAVGLVVAWQGARRWGIRHRPSRHLGVSVHALGRLSVLMLLGRLIGECNNLVDRNMLSYLAAGSIAALGFARSIFSLPFEVFTTGITRVVIAHFSWSVAQNDFTQLRRDLSLSVRLAAFFMVPATVGLIVLRVSIVQVLYQRGVFDQAATEATALALLFLSLGLYFRALNFIGGRVFIARQRMAFPIVASLLVLAAHVSLNLALIPIWQLAGIALSLTLTEVAATVLYYGKLRRDLGPLDGRRILIALVKIGLAAGVMAALVAPLDMVLHTPTMGTLARAGLLVVAVLWGLAVYGGTLYLVRLEELRIVLRMGRDFVRRRVGPRATPGEWPE